MLDTLRALALIVVVVGGVVSLALFFRAGSNSRLLIVLFVGWISAPYLALGWANLVSTRWRALTRTTLYCVTLLITLGSLAYYGGLILPPAGSARAFVFVMLPLVSWILAAIL